MGAAVQVAQVVWPRECVMGVVRSANETTERPLRYRTKFEGNGERRNEGGEVQETVGEGRREEY